VYGSAEETFAISRQDVIFSVRGLGVVVGTPRYKNANIAFWMHITFYTKNVKELQIE
jgi:hypothetical protein